VEVFDPASTRDTNSESELLYDWQFIANQFCWWLCSLGTDNIETIVSNSSCIVACVFVATIASFGFHGNVITGRCLAIDVFSL
jgi:hypothetical protein